MKPSEKLHAGDRVLVGRRLIEVSGEFASSLLKDDIVLGIAATGELRRIPARTDALVSAALDRAVGAFEELSECNQEAVTEFYREAARLLANDNVFADIEKANKDDVASASQRGRSTTRLELTPKMRSDMIAAFRMWADFTASDQSPVSVVEHDGWSVAEWRAPLGVVGFVFEGRPNVFADATGVLRGGNTVVFRIGSDALGTARRIMSHVVEPALQHAQLPMGCISLIDSPEHAAGWSLFSQPRLALAVARGSGDAVAELGSIAQQTGIPVSLHGTGGAWLLVGEHHQPQNLFQTVQHSLDRKVCNTMNVVCVLRHQAAQVVPQVSEAAHEAARQRSRLPRIHAVGGAEEYLPTGITIDVTRAEGSRQEAQVTVASVSDLSHEFEWEENPEFFVVLVDTLDEAVELFNTHSPQFIVSICSDDVSEKDLVWRRCNAPFVGDGFTRWVDGQFALLRPELGLSNWQSGRLFARSGILSGDSVYSVRLKVSQQDSSVHR